MSYYENHVSGKRLVGIKEYMEYLGIGKNSAIRFGEDIGAKILIGSRSLYDLKKTDEYLDSITSSKQSVSQKK